MLGRFFFQIKCVFSSMVLKLDAGIKKILRPLGALDSINCQHSDVIKSKVNVD